MGIEIDCESSVVSVGAFEERKNGAGSDIGKEGRRDGDVVNFVGAGGEGSRNRVTFVVVVVMVCLMNGEEAVVSEEDTKV